MSGYARARRSRRRLLLSQTSAVIANFIRMRESLYFAVESRLVYKVGRKSWGIQDGTPNANQLLYASAIEFRYGEFHNRHYERQARF